MRTLCTILCLFACATLVWSQRPNATEIYLERTIVPELNFKEASLSSVLDYLSKRAPEHPLNFVPLYPPATGEKPITLNLTQVPLKVVLAYIGDLASVEFIADPHAIRVIPLTQKNDAGH